MASFYVQALKLRFSATYLPVWKLYLRACIHVYARAHSTWIIYYTYTPYMRTDNLCVQVLLLRLSSALALVRSRQVSSFATRARQVTSACHVNRKHTMHGHIPRHSSGSHSIPSLLCSEAVLHFSLVSVFSITRVFVWALAALSVCCAPWVQYCLIIYPFLVSHSSASYSGIHLGSCGFLFLLCFGAMLHLLHRHRVLSSCARNCYHHTQDLLDCLLSFPLSWWVILLFACVLVHRACDMCECTCTTAFARLLPTASEICSCISCVCVYAHTHYSHLQKQLTVVSFFQLFCSSKLVMFMYLTTMCTDIFCVHTQTCIQTLIRHGRLCLNEIQCAATTRHKNIHSHLHALIIAGNRLNEMQWTGCIMVFVSIIGEMLISQVSQWRVFALVAIHACMCLTV